jgi:alpha-galactosidase
LFLYFQGLNPSLVQRLQFIRSSGAALAGLLLTRRSAMGATGSAGSGSVIALPTSILVGLDSGMQTLSSASAGTYRYKDVVVRLKEEHDELRVDVESPSQPLHFVRLEWQLSIAGGTVLADDWERTYGDDGFRVAKEGRKMPWYFIHHQGSRTLCYGVKTGCQSLCYWDGGGTALRLTMDTKSAGVGVVLGARMLRAADIVVLKGKEEDSVFVTARKFCRLMCDKPRLARMPVYGINDWYYAYGNNTPELILRQTSMMTELAIDPSNRPFSVVDAGWAQYSPYHPGDGGWMDDFSRPNEKFKDMAKLAGDIRKLGMRPGLWTRPLCASYKDAPTLLLPTISGRDDAKSPVLDPTIDENLERIRHNISLYRQWGYDMVKHDYTTYDIFGRWGFQMGDDVTAPGWRFHDNTRTTAEILLSLYRAIREAAGEMYLIGCNTLSHLSAGIFELNRIGDDTSGKEWARTRRMGVNTLGFRLIQNGLFYAADGDCVGVTKDIPWEKTRQWMQLVAGTGSPLFISAEPEIIGAEQRTLIRESFSLAARRFPPGEPLDWLTNPQPSHWRLDGRLKEFNWE